MKEAFRAWVAYNIITQILGLIAAAIGYYLSGTPFLNVWAITAAVSFIGLNILWFILWLWHEVLEPWIQK